MSTEIVSAGSHLPAQAPSTALELVAIQADVLLARRSAVEKVVRELMVPGVHYGPVPGVDDSVMLDKPGSELLAASFQLALDYQVTEHVTPEGDRRYVSKCVVTHQLSGILLGTGMGEASTAETKFAWRKASSKAEYDATPEDRRREKTYNKKGGGGTFTVKQVRELADDKGNTALKMANKRAASDAIQAVLGVRGMILQGIAPAGGTAAAAPEPVGKEAVASLVAFADRNGLSEQRLLATLRRDMTYEGRLEDITGVEYGYLAFKLFTLATETAETVDPVTGEVGREEDQEESGEEPPGQDAEGARRSWAERGSSEGQQAEGSML